MHRSGGALWPIFAPALILVVIRFKNVVQR
jgi:hypothetical protein